MSLRIKVYSGSLVQRSGELLLIFISVQWLELVYEMATFFRFAKVLEENLDENG